MGEYLFDAALIGGGIMGCATAYHLIKAQPEIRVCVVESDPTYRRASTTLSLANIRTQFSLKENIRISLHAFETLDRFAEELSVGDRKPDIAFHHEGNLFLVPPSRRSRAEENLALQRKLGGSVSWLSPEQVRARFPLFNTTGMAGGTLGALEGYVDAYSMLMGYRDKGISLGVTFLHDEVKKILAREGRIEGLALASGRKISAGCVVNCAGAWAAEIARTVGVELPIKPIQRQVFVLDTQVKPKAPLPLTVLPSGLYFRTETGGLILAGKSMADDREGFDFLYRRERFEKKIWPELVAFVPAFESLKLVRGWAGLYAVNTLDGNAVLGEWPLIKGLFLANGFSGHGLQQAPAVGRYLSELILKKKPFLDLSIFRPERVLENRPLHEDGLV
jgi:glycine/D-amino acid oxidase-like deaminating enzyme